MENNSTLNEPTLNPYGPPPSSGGAWAKLRLVFIVLIILIILGAVYGAWLWYNRGTLNLTVNLPHVTASVDGHSYTFDDVLITKLPAGTYQVTISKPDYGSQTLPATVTANGTTNLTATLKELSQRDQFAAAGVAGGNANDFTIKSSQSFLAGDWIVAVVDLTATPGDTAVAVFERQNAELKLKLGPGTQFSTSNLQGLPGEVVTYLNSIGATQSGQAGNDPFISTLPYDDPNNQFQINYNYTGTQATLDISLYGIVTGPHTISSDITTLQQQEAAALQYIQSQIGTSNKYPIIFTPNPNTDTGTLSVPAG